MERWMKKGNEMQKDNMDCESSGFDQMQAFKSR